MTNERGKLLFAAVFFGFLASFPYTGLSGDFALDFVTKTMIYAILALSLELLVGSTGLVCFGQAAFFGIGAYCAVLLSGETEPPSIFWLLPACIAIPALYALFVGSLSLRTKGVYFIMTTLAFAQMAYFVFHDTPLGGGTDGIFLYFRPLTGAGPDLEDDLVFYWFTLGCLVATFVFLAVLLRSRFGRALAGIRVNEQRMRATGFSTYPYKLAAFTLSGGLAGLAGFLFALKDGFVNPEMLGWHLSGALLIMIILGGLGHLRGALIGAFTYALLQEFFKSADVFGEFSKHWQLGMGLTIIVSVALMPHGIVGAPAQWRRRRAAKRALSDAARAEQAQQGTRLAG